MTKYRYLGSHADMVKVGDKIVPVEPGEFLELSDDDLKHEDNQHLMDNEFLKTEKELGGTSQGTSTPTPKPSATGGNE